MAVVDNVVEPVPDTAGIPRHSAGAMHRSYNRYFEEVSGHRMVDKKVEVESVGLVGGFPVVIRV